MKYLELDVKKSYQSINQSINQNKTKYLKGLQIASILYYSPSI